MTAFRVGAFDLADRQHRAMVSPLGPDDVARVLVRKGNVIVERTDWWRPWSHHVHGCGVGHDDALFAEAGRSFAAYLENEAEPWWESAQHRRWMFGSEVG